MKSIKLQIKAGLLVGMMSIAPGAMAGDSIKHASNAIVYSAKGVAEITTAGLKVSAGVVAVPLTVIGAVGEVSGKAGRASMDFATGKNGELPISDEVVMAGPSPQQAMQQKQPKEEI